MQSCSSPVIVPVCPQVIVPVCPQVTEARLRDLVQREMVRLQDSVQDLCRSALPLGKIMDYLQEDVDSMNLELTSWRQEKKRHEERLEEENRYHLLTDLTDLLTDLLTDPLYI